MEQKLSTVHDAMSCALIRDFEVQNNGATVTLRMPEELKGAVDEICKSNGTTISSYLRECAIKLYEDYNDTTT